jgi:AcrR family transcriptional regulator
VPKSKGEDLTQRLGSGRPTLERTEAIDAAIIDAARALFLSIGVDQTSMETVAANANVSRTTLYARYKSKDDLLRAVIDAQVQNWGREQRLFRDPLPADFKQRMHHHARAVIQMMISPDVLNFQRLVKSSAIRDKKYTQVMNEIGYRSAIEALANEISEGCREWPAPPRNPAMVGELIMGMLAGWVAGRDIGEAINEEEAIAYADQAVDILFFGRTAW